MGSLSHLVDLKYRSTSRKVANHDIYDDGFEAPRNSLELQVESMLSNCAERFTPYGYPVMNDWPGKYSGDAPMKKLISDEISKKPKNTHSTPSVVARLMGVDTLPLESRTINPPRVEEKPEIHLLNFPKQEHLKKSLRGHVSDASNSLRKKMFEPFHHKEEIKTSNKREHPQEEELQKFKKEFEAYQAARFKEYSNIVELGSVPSQRLAQEDLNKEKMAIYATRPGMSSRSTSPDNQTTCDNLYETAFAPSKIVILRPGPDKISYSEESWISSPGVSEDRGSIENFLEEVKERLKHEMQGKPSKKMVRGGGIETPYSEKPLDAKEIAQSIANQARESFNGETSMSFGRSASTRSYKSENLFNDSDSTEFFNRGTRRFLADRLRNVLKDDVPRAEQSFYNPDKQSRSFRRDPDDNVMHPSELSLSPIHLIRSLSAPVKGASFGKLLLEDRNMLTGAHIRRKHEVKHRKKEKFNLREKVLSFRYNLTLKGRLFGRKIQSDDKHHTVKDIPNVPTALINYYDSLENSTEVPPSPASICSSVQEEFWRPTDYISPRSTPDRYSMPNVFREISSNLNELRRQLNQLEAEGSEATIIEEQKSDLEMEEIEDEVESYIRDLLVASGLYDGSCDTSLSRMDPLGKPISNQVFQEVEDLYSQRIKNDEEESINNQGDDFVHKILFDLLNETLSTFPGSPKFTRKAPLRGKKLLDHAWQIIRDHVYPLDDTYYYSIDNMVARDLQSSPWSNLIDDEANPLGKEIECQIIGQLIEDIVKDMQSYFTHS